MSHYRFGVLSVRIRYTFPHHGAIYYQRAVPTDLRDRYKSPNVKHKLTSTDPVKVKREVERLNARYEAEWGMLRANPSASPAALKTHAEALLREWGLSPKDRGEENDPLVLELLNDKLDTRRFLHVERYYENPEDPEVHNNVPASEYLTPVEIEALRLLHQKPKPTVTDAMDFYFQRHEKGQDDSFQKLPRIAVEQFTTAVGNKAVEEITRADVHTWMEKSVEKGQSKGTIQRRLAALKAIFSMFIREKELDIPNRFEKHTVPATAKKAEKRETFSTENLKTIQAACKAKDDDVRWAVAMLSDTCSRLAEVVGLRLSDIVLDAPIPYISIEEHGARSLKTPDSQRVVPLVGVALWAAQRIRATACPHQVYAFPRYANDGQCNALSASAAMNKWIRSQGMNHTTHEFRHTMADRLREVGCPEDIRKQIGGWTRMDMAEKYGKGTSLEMLKGWLDKVVLP